MESEILLPAPDMKTAHVARWLKVVGDKVQTGDILVEIEIETDKATMEIEAIAAGVLAEILVPAGTADMAVNSAIGRSRGIRVNAFLPGATRTPLLLEAIEDGGEEMQRLADVTRCGASRLQKKWLIRAAQHCPRAEAGRASQERPRAGDRAGRSDGIYMAGRWPIPLPPRRLLIFINKTSSVDVRAFRSQAS